MSSRALFASETVFSRWKCVHCLFAPHLSPDTKIWYWKRNQLFLSDATVGYSTAQARSNVNTQYDVAFTEYARFGGSWPAVARRLWERPWRSLSILAT